MTDPGPLAREIAASAEDVQSLLNDNYKLSIAHLANLLRTSDLDAAKRFLAITSEVAELRKKLDAVSDRQDKMADWLKKEAKKKET